MAPVVDNFLRAEVTDFVIMEGLMPPKKPEEVMMKILLISTQAFFESPDILPERTMGLALDAAKRMLKRSQNIAEVR